MSIAKKLIEIGAEEKTITAFYRDREKAVGAMWGGKFQLKLGNMIFGFELWYHYNGNDDLSREEALEHSSLRRLQCLDHKPKEASVFSKSEEGAFYDPYWYCIVTPENIFLHRDGWSGSENPELRQLVDKKRKLLSPYSESSFGPEDAKELVDAGFEILIQEPIAKYEKHYYNSGKEVIKIY